MSCTNLPRPVPTAARPEDTTLFVALELSRKSWLVATSAPGEAKISKRTIAAGDGPSLLTLLKRLRETAQGRLGQPVTVVVIQEAGLDGFWLHRLLEANGFQSHVVDPASIAIDRRKRRRKTDAIDVEALLRTLMAWARGERRVCSMVQPPSPEDEDRRRLCREREALVTERIRHTNRIKGLLAGQGITDFEPRRPDHRTRLDELRTGDGRSLPPRLKDEIRRQLARLDAVIDDLKTVEAERDAIIGARAVTPPDGACQRRRHFSDSSRASGRRSPRYCGSRPFSGPSRTAVSSRPMRGSPRARGRAAAATATKALANPATRDCARRWSSWPGCGSATSRTRP
jgi:transposase